MALGAKGALIGRIMAYGLGAGGEAGVARALDIVRKEADTTMALMGERDRRIPLLQRLLQHAETNARYNVYFGQGRDRYDVRGRVAHESVFTVHAGSYRCPSTQQGYTPFSTWTRGLAWVLLGYAEEIEFLATLDGAALKPYGGRKALLGRYVDAACATADFYIGNTPTCGVPYWDTGAPGLAQLGDYLDRAADPYNDHEPVDSSAAAITAQGLIRLGRHLGGRTGARYIAAVCRAVPVDRTAAPGAAAARDLPPAQWLGPRAQGQQHPLRRVLHVGRLPPARTRAVHRAPRPQRALLQVLPRLSEPGEGPRATRGDRRQGEGEGRPTPPPRRPASQERRPQRPNRRPRASGHAQRRPCAAAASSARISRWRRLIQRMPSGSAIP
jgi:hypothetical protein